MVSKYGYSDVSAALWTPVPFMIVSFISPFFGALVDKIGHRMTFIIITNVGPMLAMVWAMAVPKCDDACWPAAFPMIILGISNISILNL
jgi:nitrate/nitrite transporter NarK